MRTHIENTSFNTGSFVACVYCGRCLAMGYSVVGCVFVAGLFTESFPSNGSTCHITYIDPSLTISETAVFILSN
jgi:hypothetical protein